MRRFSGLLWTAAVLASLALGACSGSKGDQGDQGPAGAPGEPCTVEGKTITCGDTSVTVADGVDGSSCTAQDKGDGTKTISCDDGTAITVANGRDGDPGAPGAPGEDGEDGQDGLPGQNGQNGQDGQDGVSCTAVDNGDGSMTITCGQTVVTIQDGDDGAQGPTGQDGEQGPAGQDGANGTSCTVADNGDGTKTISCTDGTSVTVADGQDGEGVDPDALAQLEALAAVGAESCAVCHAESGDHHQALYNQYTDASALDLTIVSVASVPGTVADTFNTTLTFTVEKNGQPFVDANGLPKLNQKRFMGIRFDGTLFVDPLSFGSITPTATPGEYTATVNGAAYALENEDAAVYAYVADEILPTEGMTLYSNVDSAGLTFNDFDTLTAETDKATVSGCQKCHGTPYMKHGYRVAEVEGLPDFAACKFCHYDTRPGSHQDWQVLVDDPLRYSQIATTPLTADEKAQYAYVATTMNDTHMSHAMEFAYPQSMANCVTCHEGKLDRILTDGWYKLETCKSCHPLNGSEEYGTAALALNTLLPESHDLSQAFRTNCASCHGAAGMPPQFDDIHPGYNRAVYAAENVRYADLFEGTIDAASLEGNILTVTFSVTESATSTSDLNAEDVVPTVLIGLYGWDTKDYIVSPHGRDANRNRYLEFTVDGVDANPRFTTVAAGGGSWTITADLSMWADKLADGSVKRAEIAATLELMDGETMLALDSPSRTFDLTTNAFDDGYFQDIVDVQSCNACHEALGTTFHSASYGGNIRTCRLCHVTLNGGSHLELQSRSIDSYVHSIHSMQPFDTGDIDFSDPVEALRYEHHIESGYPTFTILNCQSCHVAGTFNVPDQSKSLPGVHSAADSWTTDRNIGAVPAFITGPGSRACGGCHRAALINEDAAGHLAAYQQHMKSNGYVVENVTGLFDLLVAHIMAQF